MRISASSINAVTLQIHADGLVQHIFNVCIWYDNNAKSWRHNLCDYCHDGGFGVFSFRNGNNITRELIQHLIDIAYFDDYQSPIIVEEICNGLFHGGGDFCKKYEINHDKQTDCYTVTQLK